MDGIQQKLMNFPSYNYMAQSAELNLITVICVLKE